MIVYVLFHETNSGHADESDGYIEGVYLDQEDAEAAQLAAVRAAIAAGYAVYWNPDTEEETLEWDHDGRVEPHSVRKTADLPTEGFFDFLQKAEER